MPSRSSDDAIRGLTEEDPLSEEDVRGRQEATPEAVLAEHWLILLLMD